MIHGWKDIFISRGVSGAALTLPSPGVPGEGKCARERHARWSVLLIVLLTISPAFASDLPSTGAASPAFASFDELMTSFMNQHHVPGGALAVARHGRVVYARGFGYADVETKTPVRPDSLFRIASVSKPLTAVAILQLVEQGKFKLDEKAIPLLRLEPFPPAAATLDRRLASITIQQLLNHTAGWDRDKSFDPMFRSVQIARAFDTRPPATIPQIIRYMLGRPLDSDPGERYAYSNFGYCMLGRIIEQTSGKSYESYVRANVLEPLGIRDMRIGHTLPTGRAENEVHYYAPKKSTAPAVVGEHLGEPVPPPYGAWCLETMEAHGGWIASAPDLVRFAAAFDEPQKCGILKEESIRSMFRRPEGLAGHGADGRPKAAYYGCGWMVRPVGKTGRSNTWHTGKLAGTSTRLVRRHDGLDWAVLFNTDAGPDGKDLAATIDPLVHRAADAVKTWPE